MRRFFLSPDGQTAVYWHPLDDHEGRLSDWIDCTDMDDAEFERVVRALQS